MAIDRNRDSSVSGGMAALRRLRPLLFGASLALAAGACGKKGGPATTPSAGAAASDDPGEYHDPGEIPTTTFGADPGEGPAASEPVASSGQGEEPGTTAPATPEPGPSASQPAIRPPGLDLTPAQKQARIRDNLLKARDALEGESVDAETGIAEAKAALAVDEQNLPAMLYLAHGNYAKGNNDKAEYVLRRAEKTEFGTASAKLYVLFGLVYEATDREDQAEEAYRKAVSLNPNSRSALLNLGVYHLKNKRYSEAEKIYEKLTGPLSSKSPAAWTNLGSAYRGHTARSGLDEQARNQYLLAAERSYKRAVSIDKNYGNAYYNLGLLYLDADPFPGPDGELDKLARLTRAKTYFEEYLQSPGADAKRAKEQLAVAQKLIDRENKIRERLRKRQERRRKLEQQ